MSSSWLLALGRLRKALQQGPFAADSLERQCSVLAEYLVDALSVRSRGELGPAVEAMRRIAALGTPSPRAASARSLAYWAGRINGHFDVAVALRDRQSPVGFSEVLATRSAGDRAILRHLSCRESTRAELLKRWTSTDEKLEIRLQEFVAAGVVTARGAGSDARFGLTKAARADSAMSSRTLSELLDDLKDAPRKLKVVAVVASGIRRPPAIVCDHMVHHLKAGVRYYFAVSKAAERELQELIQTAVRQKGGNNVVAVRPLEHDWGLGAMVVLKFEDEVTIAYAGSTPSLDGTDDLLVPMNSAEACTLAHLALGQNKDLELNNWKFAHPSAVPIAAAG